MELLQGPNEEQFLIIKNMLNENEGRLNNNIKLFCEWIVCQKHLPQNYDKRLITTYIRGSKHDLEKAKRKYELYFYIKGMLPEIHENRIDILKITSYIDLVSVPKLTPDGYRISIVKLTSKDASHFDVCNIMKFVSLFVDVRLYEDFPIAGGIVIIDVENFTAAHTAKFFNPVMKKMINIGAQAQPNRIKQIHIVNAQPFIETIVGLIKPLMKEKLRQRIFIHSSIKKLKDYLPIELLPKDYGGHELELNTLANEWFKYYLKQSDWFIELDKLKCTNLPKKYIFHEDNYGMDGSFRTLAID